MEDKNVTDPQLKVIIDIFRDQYSQVHTWMMQFQDDNNKAHNRLMTEVHTISTDVKLIKNNQEIHQKKVEDLEETVKGLSGRVEVLEQERGNTIHFRSTSMKIIGILGGSITMILGLWKLYDFVKDWIQG